MKRFDTIIPCSATFGELRGGKGGIHFKYLLPPLLWVDTGDAGLV